MAPSPSPHSSAPEAPAAAASARARSAASRGARTAMRTKRAVLALLLVATAVLPGCYLAHLARGQWALLRARQPVEALLADPATPEPLRQRLALVQEVRAFAPSLGLRVGDQYTTYAEWPGDRLVTAVVSSGGDASADAFVFYGVARFPYKGFFSVEAAEREAERLRARGRDTCLVPVRAYSTLGWLDDPLTGPLVRLPEPALVEVVLHEWVHATVFARSAGAFNEGLATFVGQEAAVRFFEARDGAGSPAARHARARVRDARAVAAVLAAHREALASLTPAAEPEARAALEQRTRERLRTLPLATRDPARVAERARLNPACLAARGTYEADLPRYEALLASLGGDLPALIDAARSAARSDDPRSALLAVAGGAARPGIRREEALPNPVAASAEGPSPAAARVPLAPPPSAARSGAPREPRP